MKKTIAAICALASAVAVAGYDDSLIYFSTPGPDKYADGSEVLTNECYTLVGLDADGSKVVEINYATKEKGRCSPVIYSVDAAKAAKCASWDVYLNDTRAIGDDGATLGDPAGPDENNKLKSSNAKARVAATVSVSGTFGSASATEGVSAGGYDLVGAGVQNPRVTRIDPQGDEVHIFVADTVPFVGYTLVTGNDTLNFSAPDAKGTNGNLNQDIEFVVPKKGNAQFFKISTVK